MDAFVDGRSQLLQRVRELVQPGIYEASVWMSDKLTVDAGYLMADELIAMAEKIK